MTQPVSRMYVSYLERYVSELLSHHSTFHQDCSYHAQCQATPYQTTAEPPPRQTEQHQPYLAENVPGPTPTTSGDASLVPGRSKGAPILRGLLQDTGRSTTTHLQSASSQELNNSRQQQTSLVPSQSNRVSVLRGLPQDTGRSTKTHLRSAGSQEPIDSRQQQTSPELRIIEYKPTKVPRNRGREKWRAKADELIRETPPADVWWDNISALGLEGAQALAETVLEFNNSDWMWAFPQRSVEQTDNQKHPLVKVLERYAWFAGNGHRIKFCIFELINLRQLVLLGACFVLSQVGVPKEALIEVTRICFPEVTDRYVMELWRAGAFVYQLAEKLALAGWGGRAHYLHLLCISTSALITAPH